MWFCELDLTKNNNKSVNPKFLVLEVIFFFFFSEISISHFFWEFSDKNHE